MEKNDIQDNLGVTKNNEKAINQFHLDDLIHVKDDNVRPLDVVKMITEAEGNEDPGPFMVCDLGQLIKKHREWTDAMPDIMPYYAIKCNDSLPFIKTLATLGTGFDCASLIEMKKILALGVEPDRIIYANTVKPPSHIQYACKHGIKKMIFDNEAELYKISKLYPKAHLLLRIRCDDPNVEVSFGAKYGCDHGTEAYNLLKMAKDLDVSVVGVSFHIGPVNKNVKIYETAIEYTKQVFNHGKTIGHNMYMVDIGGGFPGDKGNSINQYAAVINSSIKKHFSEPEIKFISEPGRFYASSVNLLACMVISKKKTNIIDSKTNKLKPHNMYYLNDGIHGTFAIYHLHKIARFPFNLGDKNKADKLISSSICGPTCDAADKIIEDILLPELDLYEWLLFENMGAYTFKAPQNFNGFPGPKYYYMANKSTYDILKNKQYLNENDFVVLDIK